MRHEAVPVFLRKYYIGDSEVRIHCRKDNDELVQGWLYHEGMLTDTILTVDKNKAKKLAAWFLKAAK